MYSIHRHDRERGTPRNKVVCFICDHPNCRGSRINRRDKDNFSPLLIAASNGHASTIRTLLQKGARLYDVDKNDKTALFWAAEEDNVEALEVQCKARNWRRMLITGSHHNVNWSLCVTGPKDRAITRGARVWILTFLPPSTTHHFVIMHHCRGRKCPGVNSLNF